MSHLSIFFLLTKRIETENETETEIEIEIELKLNWTDRQNASNFITAATQLRLIFVELKIWVFFFNKIFNSHCSVFSCISFSAYKVVPVV